ncbi:MAG: DUF4388 domain-containing protein [Ktedonobacteraceae bacterium]|nr:DUF4388 domain-containing protein [Ktedonobacteraceae bacterium]
MPQQRGTITERLIDVIQVIQMGRKSGLLTADRGEGRTFEEGAITFVTGQVVQATATHLTGHEALNWLKSWGTCYFTFVPAASSPAPVPRGISGGIATDTDPVLRTQPLATPKVTRPLLAYNTNGREIEPPIAPAPVAAAPYRIHQRDNALQAIEHAGLSRAHRRLLLLINGERSLPELARLTGHNRDEVSRMLYDLERAGLIRQL